jgi:hypothetical protein
LRDLRDEFLLVLRVVVEAVEEFFAISFHLEVFVDADIRMMGEDLLMLLLACC